MIDRELIAHDLAIAYVINRHGAEVRGTFDVSTYQADVSGSGRVDTRRLPDVGKTASRIGRTGGKYPFGIPKLGKVETGGFEVDGSFEAMINDYQAAYARFLDLLP